MSILKASLVKLGRRQEERGADDYRSASMRRVAGRRLQGRRVEKVGFFGSECMATLGPPGVIRLTRRGAGIHIAIPLVSYPWGGADVYEGASMMMRGRR